MDNHLPADITTEILSRLPAESVLDCRRVSKTWQTLTYHPSFAHMHLRHSLQLDDDFDDQCYYDASATASKVGFIGVTRSNDEGYQLHYGEFDENDEQQSYKTLTKIKHPPIRCEFTIVGSCNGLICFCALHHGVRDPVYIGNPVTREYIDLPRFTETDTRGFIASGFGYHPKTNEYKVVRIYCRICYQRIMGQMQLYTDGTYHRHVVGEVQVYTLGSGLGWRNIGEINYRFRFIRSGTGVLANGALHWVEIEKKKIVSFDLADEEFRLLPSPPCNGCYYQLHVLRGLLCAVQQKNENGYVFIWSLKKEINGSEDLMKGQDYQSRTWNLEFTIEGEHICRPLFMNRYEPFAITKSGEFLLWESGSSLSRYNLRTTVLEELVDYAPVSKYFCAIPHVTSFISLKALGEDSKVMGSAKDRVKQRHNRARKPIKRRIKCRKRVRLMHKR